MATKDILNKLKTLGLNGMVKVFCFFFFFSFHFIGDTAHEQRMAARGKTSEEEGNQPLEVSETQ